MDDDELIRQPERVPAYRQAPLRHRILAWLLSLSPLWFGAIGGLAGGIFATLVWYLGIGIWWLGDHFATFLQWLTR
jgi:hypothetical protein